MVWPQPIAVVVGITKGCRLWFHFLAVSVHLQAREYIHIGVFLHLAMFRGYKRVFLETDDSADHLSFQSLETKEPHQDRAVDMLSGILAHKSILVLHLHNSQ
jgi:hypothetical protein